MRFVRGAMYDEKIYLKDWKLDHPYYHKAQEIVQATPWAGGMMILTYLRVWSKKSAVDSRTKYYYVDCYKWVKDPMIEDYYSIEKGTYWI